MTPRSYVQTDRRLGTISRDCSHFTDSMKNSFENHVGRYGGAPSELLDLASKASHYQLLDPDWDDETRETMLTIWEPEAAAIEYVQGKRRRIDSTHDKPARSQASIDLDRVKCAIKDHPVLIADVLDGEAPHIPIKRSRSGQHHSACLFCGQGNDRLVIRDDWQPPMCWCRVCGQRADVISVAAFAWGNDLLTATGFRDTIMRLADQYLGGSRGIS